MELSEEKRRSKDATLSSLRDKLTESKLKIEHLDDELAKQTQKAARDYSRIKHELENVKAERDIAQKDRKELEERIIVQNNKLQSQISQLETKASEVQRVCKLKRTISWSLVVLILFLPASEH